MRHHAKAQSYERLRRVVYKLLNPIEGTMKLDEDHYHIEVLEFPALKVSAAGSGSDMAVKAIVHTVDFSTDAWLQSLSLFTKTVLDDGWRVYRGRSVAYHPSVSWQFMGMQMNLSEEASLVTWSKAYRGLISGINANECMKAASLLLKRFITALKLPLISEATQCLLVRDVSVHATAEACSMYIIDVTLVCPNTRMTS